MNGISKQLIAIIVIVVIGLIIVFKSAITIGSGEAGVMYKPFGGGVVTDQAPLGEGIHIVGPWNKVFIYETRQQQLSEKMNVLSSNGLDIKLDATVWFKPEVYKLGLLHQQKGEEYVQRIIIPALRSATRSIIGRYTPEELYSSKRDTIQLEILNATKSILETQYVDLEKVLVRDITLPVTIKDAIERKLRQEQESLEYEFRLTKAQKEAERQKIEAEGKARANEILNASLTDRILKEKGIQATLELSKSTNAKVIVIGSGKDGLPIILGDQ
ncbi:membrane protein [Neptunitalea chrysea]|uniref:Membrane protein n=1 Tax=Neptunitalea chrysea TaxID=1647581 RepID=A0A9W6B2T2_9FLAO|nr:prohibitin family protein [Neptunitalea chrysea]GLB51376.1 membrane protein [Neptunitalea chrysea]